MTELHKHHEDHPEMVSRNARRGLILFLIYFSFYLVFVCMNVFAPATMARTSLPLGGDRELPLGGPNIAVVFGISLIFVAIILSLVYMRMTRKPSI